MSYEELLALCEKIGTVSKGLKIEQIEKIPIVVYDEKIDDRQCSICCDNYELGSRINQLPGCRHVFHIECLR